MADTCPCVKRHSPQPAYYQHHHIVPQSWLAQGAQPATPEIAVLCGTSHDAVHDLLNQYVHHGGSPPAATLRRYTAHVRDLAQIAWSQRPSDQPPYTTAAG